MSQQNTGSLMWFTAPFSCPTCTLGNARRTYSMYVCKNSLGDLLTLSSWEKTVRSLTSLLGFIIVNHTASYHTMTSGSKRLLKYNSTTERLHLLLVNWPRTWLYTQPLLVTFRYRLCTCTGEHHLREHTSRAKTLDAEMYPGTVEAAVAAFQSASSLYKPVQSMMLELKLGSHFLRWKWSPYTHLRTTDPMPLV